jgi:hypothetical protein
MSYKQQAPLPVNEGGTGDLTLTSHGVIVAENTSAFVAITPGTNGQVLLGSTGANPVFNTLTSSDGTISFTTGAGTLDLSVATELAITFDADSGSATPALNVIDIAGGSNINTSGAGHTITVNLDNSISVSGSVSAGTTLTASGMTTTGIVQNSVAGLFSTYAATIHTVQIGNAAGQLTSIANGTTGEILTAQTGADPIWAAPATSVTWTDVTTATQAMVPNNGYVADRATLITFTLPTVAAFGTLMSVVGLNTGGWIIDQNIGQNIQFGNLSTTHGVGGSLASTNQYDQVDLLCIVANLTWTIRGPISNLTIV